MAGKLRGLAAGDGSWEQLEKKLTQRQLDTFIRLLRCVSPKFLHQNGAKEKPNTEEKSSWICPQPHATTQREETPTSILPFQRGESFSDAPSMDNFLSVNFQNIFSDQPGGFLENAFHEAELVALECLRTREEKATKEQTPNPLKKSKDAKGTVQKKPKTKPIKKKESLKKSPKKSTSTSSQGKVETWWIKLGETSSPLPAWFARDKEKSLTMSAKNFSSRVYHPCRAA